MRSLIARGMAALLASTLVACTASPAPTVSSPTTQAPPTAAVVDETIPADVAGPPAAGLAAEGGDPAAGQLGTYVWRDQGSDSPWLPGAPITVGRGEPLTVTLTPPTEVASWQARIASADPSGSNAPTVLGKGSGEPRFEAPQTGAWTVEVHVVFAGGVGDASYFWRLDVR